MFPTLFDSAWVGLDGDLHFRIPTYFAAIMTGWFVAAYLASRESEGLGLTQRQFFDFAIWMLIVGVFGARVFHVLFDGLIMDYVHLCTDPFLLDGKALKSGEFCMSNLACLAEQDGGRDIGGVCNVADGLCYPQTDCFRALKFWAGGLTVYGAIVATVPAGYYYLKKFNFPKRAILDVGGYGIPLGIALGRLGCLGAGCCFGDVCHIDMLGLSFPKGSLAYQDHFDHHYAALNTQWQLGIRTSLPVWPTQFLSTLYNFGLFALAYFWVRPRKRFHGQVLLFSIIGYAVFRFMIEFVRADQRGGAAGLSTSQIIALLMVVIAAAVYMKLKAGVVQTRPKSGEEE